MIVSTEASTGEVYFYSASNEWYLASESVLLGGPFSTFDGLLKWAVEKEFVEPKPLWAIIDDAR